MALRMFSLVSLLSISSLVLAEPSPSGNWFHPEDHEVYSLFKRQTSKAPTGSPDWIAAYPAYLPNGGVTPIPTEWSAALKKATDTGKIPNIPATSQVDGSFKYPAGVDGSSPAICNAHGNYGGCHADGEVWDAPNGSVGIGFDDGPIANASPQLYDLLSSLNQTSTHFVIGSAIRNLSDAFMQAYELGGDFAVHTWSHPYMTSLTNDEILEQFGWTFQIIYDLTGRVPKFWRPPYGDVDNRVRAIASQVFGLTTIIWNHDPQDWAIGSGDTTRPLVVSNMTVWINGPKSPGLIMLEHEHSMETVGAFKEAYALMQEKEWKTVSVARLVASGADKVVGSAYWNAENGNAGLPDDVGYLNYGLIQKAP